ncbi:hypothetical protein ACJW30_04G150800 [Castanea mollissima]
MGRHRKNLAIILHVHLLDNCNSLSCSKRTMEQRNIKPFSMSLHNVYSSFNKMKVN